MDIITVEAGGKEGRHMKLLVEIDITKPLQRDTKLKYRQNEIWVDFKYEQLPGFCFYCGCSGHSKKDVVEGSLMCLQTV